MIILRQRLFSSKKKDEDYEPSLNFIGRWALNRKLKKMQGNLQSQLRNSDSRFDYATKKLNKAHKNELEIDDLMGRTLEERKALSDRHYEDDINLLNEKDKGDSSLLGQYKHNIRDLKKNGLDKWYYTAFGSSGKKTRREEELRNIIDEETKKRLDAMEERRRKAEERRNNNGGITITVQDSRPKKAVSKKRPHTQDHNIKFREE